MKATPKSCSCYACKRGRTSKGGHLVHHFGEKSLRRKSRMILNAIVQGDDEEKASIISPASNSSYTD